MFLKRLYLKNFRNFQEARVSFGPKINLIQGPNGQGKTNLLEAIFFLSTGKSFRTPSLTDLICHKESYFYLEAEFVRDHLSQTLKVYFDGKERKIHYNNTLYQSFANLLGLMPAVLFAPEDISLIIGSPLERRRFLNVHIAQTDPLYVHHLVRYTNAMRQRNQLLKKQTDTAMNVWEEIMAVSAAYLILKRQEAVLDLISPLKAHMNELSQAQDSLKLTYLPSFIKEENLVDALRYQFQKLRRREMQLGSTLTGPHRDDLLIHISEQLAKTYASEGQKRSCISAIRFAEWERLQTITAIQPIMCVDDVGVHLDTVRQSLFQGKLQPLGQVFLTSPFDLSIEAHKLLILNGNIS
ncbi:MAG: DNA replication/repair protein RecF [Chlamydiota bacterium]